MQRHKSDSHLEVGDSDPVTASLLGPAKDGTNGQVRRAESVQLRTTDQQVFESASGLLTLSTLVPSNPGIRFTEVAPSDGHWVNDDGKNFQNGDSEDFWRMSLHHFTSKRRGKNTSDLPRRVKSYYKKQDELIQAFEETMDLDDIQFDYDKEDLDKKLKRANLLAKSTFFVNLSLMIVKLVASILSGSLVVISSLVDSCVDLMSGVVIWWTTRAVQKRNRYVYPEGRTRLEPVAIVILSVIMSVASVQLIAQSTQSLVGLAALPGNEGAPVMTTVPIVFLCVTIATKLVLYILCRVFSSPLTAALAQDHRNDILSNTVALVCGLLAYHFWKHLDPIGAIIMSVYIFISWWITGSEQIRNLTGYTAKPQLLKKLTWICLNHHKEILYIDTVRAFHFGTNFIVEVDIVLPEDMSLKDAHNIGEPLQQKLEKLDCVERAFVHLDYEFQHNPNTEHKVV